MKLTASSMRPQMRARRCCELPLESKNEAMSERVPITMVQSAIRGVEKSRERTRLIVSPQSYQQQRACFGDQEERASDDNDIVGRRVAKQLERGGEIGRDAQVGMIGNFEDGFRCECARLTGRGDDDLLRARKEDSGDLVDGLVAHRAVNEMNTASGVETFDIGGQ